MLVHGRSPAKVASTVETLGRHSPGKVHGFVADLSNMGEVRRLGSEVGAQFPSIHGLLNNAGTFAGDYTGKRVVTREGNEYSLAVNVLAPFLLTSLLLPNVLASGTGRILITSSISAGSNDALDDLQCARCWSDHRAYELSKLCDARAARPPPPPTPAHPTPPESEPPSPGFVCVPAHEEHCILGTILSVFSDRAWRQSELWTWEIESFRKQLHELPQMELHAVIL